MKCAALQSDNQSKSGTVLSSEIWFLSEGRDPKSGVFHEYRCILSEQSGSFVLLDTLSLNSFYFNHFFLLENGKWAFVLYNFSIQFRPQSPEVHSCGWETLLYTTSCVLSRVIWDFYGFVTCLRENWTEEVKLEIQVNFQLWPHGCWLSVPLKRFDCHTKAQRIAASYKDSLQTVSRLLIDNPAATPRVPAQVMLLNIFVYMRNSAQRDEEDGSKFNTACRLQRRRQMKIIGKEKKKKNGSAQSDTRGARRLASFILHRGASDKRAGAAARLEGFSWYKMYRSTPPVIVFTPSWESSARRNCQKESRVCMFLIVIIWPELW